MKDIVDKLANEKRYEELESLANGILTINNFDHFDSIENGKIYKERAQKTVSVLKESID